jgi:type I restriction enzyme, R subunit
MTEADTCRKFVVPLLQKAGWDNDPHSIAEQRYFTAGRIVAQGQTARRRPGKRTDYLLRYTRDLPLAVVEAKAAYKHPADGLQQAKEHATILSLPFAYATNGTAIIEFDFLTGHESQVAEFPTPDDLWARYRQGGHLSDPAAADRFLTPFNLTAGKIPHYYQRIAIDRIIQAILGGRRRVLVTMATGTGKTVVAFQICWKLWSSRWNRTLASLAQTIQKCANRRSMKKSRIGCHRVDMWHRMGYYGTQYEGTEAAFQNSQVHQPAHGHHELAG